MASQNGVSIGWSVSAYGASMIPTVCRVRDSLDARLRHAERLEKRLLGLLAEREKLRKLARVRAETGLESSGRGLVVVCGAGSGGAR